MNRLTSFNHFPLFITADSQYNLLVFQQAFNYANSTTETLEKGKRHVQS